MTKINITVPAVISAQVTKPKEMLSVGVTQDGRMLVRINSSSLVLAQSCWRKFDLTILRGLRPQLEPAATLFGSAIHKGLEVFYCGDRTERRIPSNYASIMQMIACGVWQEEWVVELFFRAARAFVLKAEPLSALPPENKRSIACGVWILQHYFQAYLTDPYTVLIDEKGPMVERSFTMRIHEDDKLVIETFGQIDLIVRNEVTGTVLPADHKTTSQLGQSFYQRLKPNHQYTFYTWAARDVFGLDTTSFLVNALQVKEKPKTSRGTPPDFARQITSRTPEDFEDLRHTLCLFVNQFLRLREEGYFPQSAPGPCSDYGGCSFLELCSAPSSLHPTIIKSRYLSAGGQLP